MILILWSCKRILLNSKKWPCIYQTYCPKRGLYRTRKFGTVKWLYKYTFNNWYLLLSRAKLIFFCYLGLIQPNWKRGFHYGKDFFCLLLLLYWLRLLVFFFTDYIYIYVCVCVCVCVCVWVYIYIYKYINIYIYLIFYLFILLFHKTILCMCVLVYIFMYLFFFFISFWSFS